jgi:hypothetical protein
MIIGRSDVVVRLVVSLGESDDRYILASKPT